MTSNPNVLTGLMERRALEAAFAALAEASSFPELARRADEIAKYGQAALPVLVARLDTEDPQVRGGLGEVALRLDRERVSEALRGVLRSRGRSQAARLAAATILDRYLGEPAEASLLAGIGDPESVAIRSLNELIAAMADDETALLEYLTQLAAQPPETAGLILASIPRITPHPHLVALLRLLAQDAAPRQAQEAIEQLGRLRMPEALLALEALAVTLPPLLSRLAERNARKLRLSGVRGAEVKAPHWRTLMSPVDGTGAQVIWFNRPAENPADEMLLTAITRDPGGIVAFFGAHQAAGERLPSELPIGSVSTLPGAEGSPTLRLLEAPFDAGRYAVRAALARHWEAGTIPPLEYRFWNAQLWNVGALPEEMTPPQANGRGPAAVAALLDHPAFADWFWRDEAVLEAVQRLGPRPGADARASMICKLAALHFGPEASASYARRLEAMARWLALAGEPEAAGLASAAAIHLTSTLAPQSAFVRRLIGIGLDVAAASDPARQT